MSIRAEWVDEDAGLIVFRCPGCENYHTVHVKPGNHPTWGWNGSMELPTFTPSVLVKSGHYADGHKAGDRCWCTLAEENPDKVHRIRGCFRCHSFVLDGTIRFLPDSTHALAGQTVELPEIE